MQCLLPCFMFNFDIQDVFINCTLRFLLTPFTSLRHKFKTLKSNYVAKTNVIFLKRAVGMHRFEKMNFTIYPDKFHWK